MHLISISLFLMIRSGIDVLLKKILIGTLAFVGGVMLLMIFLGYATNIGCDHELAHLSSSPDNKYSVRHEVKSCENKPDEIEITLYSKEKGMGYGIYSAKSEEKQDIKLAWLKDKELLVTSPYALVPERNVYDHEVFDVFVKYKHFYEKSKMGSE